MGSLSSDFTFLTRSGGEEIEVMGFEPQVNQRLLPPTFPRYTHLRSRTEALNFLLQLMERIKTICKIKEEIDTIVKKLRYLIGLRVPFMQKNQKVFIKSWSPSPILSLILSSILNSIVSSTVSRFPWKKQLSKPTVKQTVKPVQLPIFHS